MFDISRYKDLEYLAIMEARSDPAFKSALLQPGNAKNAIETKFKVKLPEAAKLRVIEDKKNEFTIALPPDDSDTMMEDLKENTYW